MSCCNDKCGCGAGCKCGSSCGGCKMYPDMSFMEEASTTQTLILGVAPEKSSFGEAEMGMPAENDKCKCGPDCKCNPCTCK